MTHLLGFPLFSMSTQVSPFKDYSIFHRPYTACLLKSSREPAIGGVIMNTRKEESFQSLQEICHKAERKPRLKPTSAGRFTVTDWGVRHSRIPVEHRMIQKIFTTFAHALIIAGCACYGQRDDLPDCAAIIRRAACTWLYQISLDDLPSENFRRSSKHADKVLELRYHP